MTERKYFTIQDYESVYRRGGTKIYELINAGELKTVKAGARTLITAESAEAYDQRLREAAGISADSLNERDDGPRAIGDILASAFSLVVTDRQAREALVAVVSALPSASSTSAFFQPHRST